MWLFEFIGEKIHTVGENLDQRELNNGMETDKKGLVDGLNRILETYKVTEYQNRKAHCETINRDPRQSQQTKNALSEELKYREKALNASEQTIKNKLYECVISHGYAAKDSSKYFSINGFSSYLNNNWKSLTKKGIKSYLDKSITPGFPYYFNLKQINAILKKNTKYNITSAYLNTTIANELKNNKKRCNNALEEKEAIKIALDCQEKLSYKKNNQPAIDKEAQNTKEDIENKSVSHADLAIEYINGIKSKNGFNIENLGKILGDNWLDSNTRKRLKQALESYTNSIFYVMRPWEDTDWKKSLKSILIETIKKQLQWKFISTGIVINVGKSWGRAGIKAMKPKDETKTVKHTTTDSMDNDELEENDDENDENENYDDSSMLNEIQNIQYNSLYDLKTEILKIWDNNDINLKDNDTKMDMYLYYWSFVYSVLPDILNENENKPIVMAYALACGITDINNDADLNEFIKTVQSDDWNGNISGKYAEQYKKFLSDIWQYYETLVEEIAIQSLTARYEAAAAVAEGRNFYESDFINFAISTSEDQPQSWLKIASNISDIDKKLLNNDDYTCKPNRTEHEEAALKYTAFDITFKNTFNLTNPIIEKLGAQQVDLRSDLFKYGMYNQDTNTFNQSARDKYVAEKLEPIWLAPEEIEELWNAMTRLPTEVENNYYILSGNFDTDQDNFEKIAKIYALGEILDNIRNLFKNNEIFSDNAKLGDVMWFEFDESEPADIVWDCLLLKWKVNWTETKIKYDLRTWKLYMNAMTQQEFNPPKITIGNDEPNTEIWNLWNFDDLLEWYQPTLFTQADKVDYSKPSNENATVDENGGLNKEEVNGSENKDSNQKTLERLMENKLLEKLTIIWNTVREKAWEQSKENNVIDEFLRTFNILPDEWNSDTIEFLWWSNLYILLESIKNTNDEDYLLKFSKLMSELMSFCGLTRWKNNLSPKDPDFDSVTIFNIDEKNATQDIISLQRANQSFFSDGEKDRIKGCECHFDSSVNLSFANIIVQKCCRRYWEWWKISTNHAQEFVDSVKKWIEDIRHDESDVVAMENIIEDESMWN